MSPEFILTLQNLLPEKDKMWVLSAKHQDTNLGSILIAGYGNKAEYIAGAVNDRGKKSNTSQFLLWNAVCEMKRRGFKWFDVGGAHPEITPKGILFITVFFARSISLFSRPTFLPSL